jgi:hypothetical protein
MTNIEYLVEKLPAYTDLERWLNDRGKQGWDLVMVSGKSFIFKRPEANQEDVDLTDHADTPDAEQ